MLIREVLGAQALPFKWLSNSVAEFVANETRYGIVLETYLIRLPTRLIRAVNISFGPIIDVEQPISATNISRALTGQRIPLTILSTVADACIANNNIQNFDVIAVCAADQAKEKRFGIYMHALSELEQNLPQFKKALRLKSLIGTIVIVLCKVEFTSEEQEIIGSELGITK